MRIALAFTIALSLCGVANADQVLVMKKSINIFGSSELPKGLVIVPWKEQSPDVAFDKLKFTVSDDVFQPLDRDVFRRQLNYYKELFPVAPATK